MQKILPYVEMKSMSCLQMMKLYLFTWCDFCWEDARKHLFTLERAQSKDSVLVQLGESMRLSRLFKSMAKNKIS